MASQFNATGGLGLIERWFADCSTGDLSSNCCDTAISGRAGEPTVASPENENLIVVERAVPVRLG
jgi:hypothetical protein